MSSLSVQGRPAGSVRRFIRKNWVGYAMQLPFVVLFVLFVIAPVVVAFALSLTDYNLFQPAKFVGLKNFMDFFGSPFAYRTIRNTLVISFLQLLIEFPMVIIFAPRCMQSTIQ